MTNTFYPSTSITPMKTLQELKFERFIEDKGDKIIKSSELMDTRAKTLKKSLANMN
jgi:hypothetical protein